MGKFLQEYTEAKQKRRAEEDRRAAIKKANQAALDKAMAEEKKVFDDWVAAFGKILDQLREDTDLGFTRRTGTFKSAYEDDVWLTKLNAAWTQRWDHRNKGATIEVIPYIMTVSSEDPAFDLSEWDPASIRTEFGVALIFCIGQYTTRCELVWPSRDLMAVNPVHLMEILAGAARIAWKFLSSPNLPSNPVASEKYDRLWAEVFNERAKEVYDALVAEKEIWEGLNIYHEIYELVDLALAEKQHHDGTVEA